MTQTMPSWTETAVAVSAIVSVAGPILLWATKAIVKQEMESLKTYLSDNFQDKPEATILHNQVMDRLQEHSKKLDELAVDDQKLGQRLSAVEAAIIYNRRQDHSRHQPPPV